MIKFIITAVIVLICVFFIVLLGTLMLWVIVKMLRGLFPAKFTPSSNRKGDEV